VQRSEMTISGALIAGGRSRRMGRDKRLLVWRGRTLLERAVDLLDSVCDEVLFVSPNPPPIPVTARHVADIYPKMGVLGGLHAALTEARSDKVLCIAVDTPLLTPDWLRFLAERSERADVPCVPRAGGRIHPLPGCYTRPSLSAMETALRAGGGAVHRLLIQMGAVVVSEPEALAAGCPPACLANLNTPDDFKLLSPE
jgi:molybdopterin-guanine dinucleotide biosynthesis protein A